MKPVDNSEKATILIVDDSKTYIFALSKLLKGEYNIMVADSGPAALEAASGEKQPDLILLDIEMPDMNGYEVCRHLKGETRTADIPVIFVTALDASEDEETGLKLGAMDYISKPFHPAIVRARVRNQIRRKLAEEGIKKLYSQLDEEVSKAEKIHQRILPESIPEPEGISIAAHYQPAARMGGDLYNVVRVANKLILFISDVTGHGMDGAMISVFAKEVISGYISLKPAEITPLQLIQHLYRQFCQENFPDDQFICVFIGVIDLNTLELTYTSAGFQAQPLIKYGDGRKGYLDCSGLFIGRAIPPELFNPRENRVALTAGTTVFISTDGLEEHENNGELFKPYYEDIFFQSKDLPPEIIVQAINKAFYTFNNNSPVGDDDLTYLVLQIDREKKEQHRLTISSSFAEMEPLHDQIMGLTADFPESDNLMICLNEIIANAIEHGNRFHPEKKVTIDLTITSRYVLAAVEDEGEGFNWHEKTDKPVVLDNDEERGRGICMTGLVSGNLFYNRKGNRVTLLLQP